MNSLTAGTPSLLLATRTLFAGQRLSPEAMECLEQSSQATQGLLEGTVVPGDLQQMQYTSSNLRAPPRTLPTPSDTLLAAPPSFSQPPLSSELPPLSSQMPLLSSQARVDLTERDLDILIDICHQRQREYSQFKRGGKGPFWEQI